MRSELELPRLSLRERDRRWALVRKSMREQGLDCLLLFGWPSAYDFYTANARYVCPIGGNSTTHVLVFPLEGEPSSFVGMPTFVGYWRIAQNWVADVRSRTGTYCEVLLRPGRTKAGSLVPVSVDRFSCGRLYGTPTGEDSASEEESTPCIRGERFGYTARHSDAR